MRFPGVSAAGRGVSADLCLLACFLPLCAPVFNPPPIHSFSTLLLRATFGSPGASVAPAAGDRLPVGSARVRPPGGLRSTLQGQGSGKRLWARLGPGRPRDSRTAQTRASSSSGARPENPESRCGSAPDGAGVGLLACPAGPGVTHLPVGNCFPPEQASGPRLGWPGTRGLPRAGPGCGRRRGPARTSAWQRESRLFLGYAGCSHLFSESGGIGMPGS